MLSEKKVNEMEITLETIIVVEKTLQEADTVISKKELKRKLPLQITHQILNLILKYLEKKGKILIGSKGITWIFIERKELNKLIKRGTEI